MSENTKMPTVALRGVTIIPGIKIHFDISRVRSINAAESALSEGVSLFLVTQLDPADENPDFGEVYKVGTIAKVRQLIKLPNKAIRVLVEGVSRGKVVAFEKKDPYIVSEIIEIREDDTKPEDITIEAMDRVLKDLLSSYAKAKPSTAAAIDRIQDNKDLEQVMNEIINNVLTDYTYKQRYLEAYNIEERYEVLVKLLSEEIKVNSVMDEFHKKVKVKVDKSQKDYILREQMSVIREELGEDNVSDADHYVKDVEKLNASQMIKDKILKEVKRFTAIGVNSAESGMLRSYIETMLEMPWNNKTKDNIDLKNAAEILDNDHYGLEEVKERMLEFLAVRKLTEDGGSSPIVCLVGPPGTGKTSIAKSIADALNRKYVRICLGGVRDEAEIRGHRKTYVGAMPGRIAMGIKQAGTKNPLMLLDEIDKLGNDYRGDPSSALLEVLDSEQNMNFRDHYIEAPIDLSEILFIATANTTATIPRPLLDRVEIIELSSYTDNEKEHIAKGYLIKKQIAKNGLKTGQLSISDEAIRKIIQYYTKEAGVRNLERKIGAICRKAAKEIVMQDKKSVKVTSANLKNYLGVEKYSVKKANEEDQTGIVRGLAWTSVGGETLQIEVNVMPGKGKMLLTGQLGDVMKESASAGLTYIRSIADNYNIKPEFFDEHDIHIHIPEGAVPKDGPSAGVTMATAMLSAVTGIKVKADVAMTGEITLRGRVLPIGGLKEKMLAAKSAGIRTVIVPAENKSTIEEISQDIKQGMNIVYVDNMDVIIDEAFVK